MTVWNLITDSICDANFSSVLLFIAVFLLIHLVTRKPAGIPPGSAFTLPVTGDLPLLIGGGILRTFRKLRQKHGDIFSFYIGKELTVVINGFNLIQKAAVKNGHIFSGRPQNLVGNISGKGKGISMSEGPFWKRQRKFTFSCLQEFGFGKSTLEEKMLKEAECFIYVLQEKRGNPFDIKETIQASVSNVIFKIICGKRHQYDDEMYLRYLRNQDYAARKIVEASVLLSCAPILQYIPGDPLHLNTIKENFAQWYKYITNFYDEHKKTHDKNNPRDYIDLFITEMSKPENSTEQSDFSIQQLNVVARDLFAGGTETTSTAIQWSLLYLLKHPEIQQRLQSDIDKIVPDGHLPCLDDRPKIPYVEAFIMEVLRCANILPMAVPHAVATNNDFVVFEGYTIPRGTSVVFNLDSVLQDPNIFENPSEFNPGRFLDADGSVMRPKEWIPFGIGRRVCLGEAVAKMELFLYLTTMIKRFEFLSEADSEPDLDGILGITYSPKQFKIRAIERIKSVK